MKKYIFAIGLFFSLSFSVNATAFNDVGYDNPYRVAISNLHFFDIIKGYEDGGFHPNEKINRAEFTKIVIGAVFESTEIDKCTGSSFSDIPVHQWFTPYICLASTKSIVSGYADKTFKPEQTITFAEAAKIIIKTFSISTMDENPWYKPFIMALELRRASPSSIVAVGSPITRGEMAEMIFRLRENIVDSENSTTAFFASLLSTKSLELKKSSCGINNFSTAFILLTKPGASGPSEQSLERLKKLAVLFDKAFFRATNYYGKMVTDLDIAIVPIKNDMLSVTGYSNASLNVFSIDDRVILKEFYKTHADDYDFVTIFPDSFYLNPALPPDYSPDEPLVGRASDPGTKPKYQNIFPSSGPVRNRIQGIGKPVFGDDNDIFNEYGSAKRLLTISELLPPKDPAGLTDPQVYELLHETGHNWCCGIDNPDLAISDGGHFNDGLVGPYRSNVLTTGGISHFAINPKKNEFLIEDVSKNVTYMYHPFALYFMGLLPENEYKTLYDIYKLTTDSNTFGSGDAIGKATFIRKISVDNIIKVMGKRSCELGN